MGSPDSLCVLFDAPPAAAEPHVVVVTHGCAPNSGSEFVVRLSATGMTAPGQERALLADVVEKTLMTDLAMFRTMQERTRFRPNETAQVTMFQVRGDGMGLRREGTVCNLAGPPPSCLSRSRRPSQFASHQENGDRGVSILLDSVLKGINYTGEGEFDEEGQRFDEDYWPQHFLQVIHPRSRLRVARMSSVRAS